ncbi:hypothetical protein BHE74_00000371 [Ensete ventricosum]|nr:hypothetical protein BHE74_00000371 [Ensete ventricosum]RZR93554.1 hypothetical protein BHM03_00022088 [Ensete ventricosum]
MRLRCDFVAACGVGCSKGAAAIGERWGSSMHDCCRGGQRWYETIVGHVHFDAGCDQGSCLGWKIEARLAAIMEIAWKGGGDRDGSRGSKIAALILDDRTPEGAL